MADIRFYVNEIITHENVGRLYPKAYSFGEPLTGVGEATLVVPMPSRLNENSLLHRIIPIRFELEITDGDPLRGGTILWAGYFISRLPDPQTMLVTFQAVHWRGWFFHRLIPPKTWTNNMLSGDQYTIAYNLIDWACAPSSAYKLVRSATTSGITRQLTVNPWWSIGQALDTLGKRDGGFEWSISFRRNPSNGFIQGLFELWVPGAKRSSTPLLYIDSTRTTNNALVGPIEEDGSIQATRVFATSDGDDPVYSSDVDAGIATGTVLLIEESTTYQDNRNRSLLFDYARAERLARNNPYTTVDVSIPEDSLKLGSYRTGDRARLRISDGWRDMDESGIRIVNRSVRKDDGKPIIITLELDMTDISDVA